MQTVKFGEYSDSHIIHEIKEVMNIIDTYTYPRSVKFLHSFPSLEELRKTRKYLSVVKTLLCCFDGTLGKNIQVVMAYCVFRIVRVTYSDIMFRIFETKSENSEKRMDKARKAIVDKAIELKNKNGLDFSPVFDSRFPCPPLSKFIDVEKLDLFALLHSGNIKKIKQNFIEGEQTPRIRNFFQSCLQSKNLEVAKILLTRVLFEEKFVDDLFEKAVEEGNEDIVEMFFSTHYKPGDDLFDKSKENLKLYKVFSKYNYDMLQFREIALTLAAKKGDLEFIKFVFEEECVKTVVWKRVFKEANKDAVKYIEELLKDR